MRNTVVAILGKYNLHQRTLADMHVTETIENIAEVLSS